MGQTTRFKRPDGQSVQGCLAEPGGGNAPGVVVIQEWWGEPGGQGFDSAVIFRAVPAIAPTGASTRPARK